jgi:hypothetical protein
VTREERESHADDILNIYKVLLKNGLRVLKLLVKLGV